jgi:hypothetical protein
MDTFNDFAKQFKIDNHKQIIDEVITSTQQMPKILGETLDDQAYCVIIEEMAQENIGRLTKNKTHK